MCNYFPQRAVELPDPYLNEEKSIRILNHMFSKNLQNLIKQNKALFDEMDEPSKVRLRKQEQVYLTENCQKKIFNEYHERLVKQMVERNNLISQTINNFSSDFYSKFPQLKDLLIKTKNQKASDSLQKTSRVATIQHRRRNPIRLTTHGQLSQKTKSRTFYKRNQNLHHRNASYTSEISALDSARNNFCRTSTSFRSANWTKRNLSCHSESNNQSKMHSSTNLPEEQHQQNNSLMQLSSDFSHDINANFFETFRPFCGLNTKQIFVKKPIMTAKNFQNHQEPTFTVNTKQKQQNPQFVSRSLVRGKNSVMKNKTFQQFIAICYTNNNYHYSDRQDIQKLVKQKINKISSDLAIKTLEPQGYRGKTRTRIRYDANSIK